VFAEADTGLAGQTVSMLGETGVGQIWVGTLGGGLYAIDTAAQRGAWLERKGLGAVHAMQRLLDGSVWVARASGIEQREAGDGRLQRRLQHDVRKPWSLRHNDVSSLLRDRSGWLWVGSYGGGLQRHNPGEAGLWVRRAEGQGALAEADVRSVLALDGGEVWLGTAEAGVAVLDAELRLVGELRPGPDSMAAGTIGAMVRETQGGPQRGIWLASDGQLSLFDAQRHRLAQWQISQGRIRRLLAASDGRLWIATQDGLYRLDDRGAQPQRVPLADGQGLFGNINALAEDQDGRLWVGGDAGLFQIPPGGRRLQALARHAAESLPELPVVGLLVDSRQQLWVDSNGGLFRLRDATAATPAFEAVGATRGLGRREFGANLLEDQQGRIWTQRGVLDLRTGARYALTTADGADIGTGWFRSYAALPDGRLLFGGSTGLLVIEPARFRPWADQPPLAITELRVAGRPAAQPRELLILEPGQRSFALEFAALDLSSPMRNRYRYRLEGLDEDWTEVSASARVLGYANLQPGDYGLRVQGSNRVGVWSPHELKLTLRVLPAWWQSWWTRVAALLLVLGAIFALVQVRTRQLRRRQTELEAKVRERTLELEDASLTDPLTGLRNRRFLNQHIVADTLLAIRHHEERLRGNPVNEADLIFFLVDMDHFKRINDDHGHAAGDAVIQQMRERLQRVFRDSDHLVRWGGEEFLIVARNTDRAQAPELANRVRQVVAEQAFEIGDSRRIYCSVSLGFACFPPLPAQPRLLDWHQSLRLADMALYDAKQRGRDAWTGVLQIEQLPPSPPAEWLQATGVSVLRS
jgi:diguanylate cyclase (GGDEF)-like protein